MAMYYPRGYRAYLGREQRTRPSWIQSLCEGFNSIHIRVYNHITQANKCKTYSGWAA